MRYLVKKFEMFRLGSCFTLICCRKDTKDYKRLAVTLWRRAVLQLLIQWVSKPSS